MTDITIDLSDELDEWGDRGFLGKTKYVTNWPFEGVVSYFFGISNRPGSKIRFLGNIDQGVLINHQLTLDGRLAIDECFLAHLNHVYYHPTVDEAIVWDLQNGYENLTSGILDCHPFKDGLLVKKRKHIGYYANRCWIWLKDVY